MGCAPSKQSVCRNCNAQCSPVRKSYSSHAHYSPPPDHDNHHVVALTSTTLGHLLLDQSKPNQVRQDPAVAEHCQEPVRRNVPEKNNNDFGIGVIEAKTWSKMIDEKITKITPKTPIRTPPGEPETINSWELMEGLDDSSPLLLPSAVDLDHIGRFSFNRLNSNLITLASQEKDHEAEVSYIPSSLQFTGNQSDSKSNTDDTFDCDLNAVDLTQPINENQPSIGDDTNKPLHNGAKEPTSCGKEKLILYFTSLRGVRKTYEDCCHVRAILKSSGVRVDERDVSMHSGFKEELKELLGDQFGRGGLPKVFVGKKFMGGADEIKKLHDEFQLEKALEGCEMADDGCGNGGEGGGSCGACGDIRFLPCETCSGSCKVYNECNSDEDKEEEESDYGFQRCPDCNENGLVRCPICCH